MTEYKWITSGAKDGCQGVKYHTEKKCVYLKNAKDYREARPGELEWHEAEECSKCQEIRKRRRAEII